MSCLNVCVSVLNERLETVAATVLRSMPAVLPKVLNERLETKTTLMSRAQMITPTVLREKLKVAFGIICELEDLKYVHVSPEEVVWITDGEVVTYTVESNTDWRVELEGESVDGEQISMLLNSYSLSNDTLISNGEEAIVLVALGNNYMVENSTLLRND